MAKLNKNDTWNTEVDQAAGTSATYTMATAGTYADRNIALTVNAAGYDVVSKDADGLCPQLPNETTINKFLRQDGTWKMPEHIIASKTFDDVWAAPLDKTTAEAKAINSKASGTQDGSTWAGQYMIYMAKIRNLGIDKTSATTATATWDSSWHVKLRLTIQMFYRNASGEKFYHSDGKSQHYCDIYGNGTTYTYSNFNNKYNWTTIYYDFINPPTAAYMKSTNDSPVLWGVNFYSTNSTYSNRSYYKREILVDVLEATGCEVEFLNDWICARNYHQDNASIFPTGSATNYSGYLKDNGATKNVDAAGFSNYNTTIAGLQESGDSDSTGLYIYSNGFRLEVGENKIYPYTFFSQTGNGTWESFVLSNSTAATKGFNPHGFLPLGKIYWNSGSSTYSGITNINAYEQYHAIDYRYSFNISTTSIPASCHTYIRWKYEADGLLYFASDNFATSLPTEEDGFVYQKIGSNYYNSNDYRGSLLLDNPYYYYKDGGIRNWTPSLNNGKLYLTKDGVEEVYTTDQLYDNEIDFGYIMTSDGITGTPDIDGLFTLLQGNPGRTGSVNLTKKASGTGSIIPAGWYNFAWFPHRTGVGEDNPEYGTITLHPMNFSGSSYILRCSSNAVAEAKPLTYKSFYGIVSKTSVAGGKEWIGLSDTFKFPGNINNIASITPIVSGSGNYFHVVPYVIQTSTGYTIMAWNTSNGSVTYNLAVRVLYYE